MSGQPNVNPFAKDYADKIAPTLDAAIVAARSEFDGIIDNCIRRYHWICCRLFRGLRFAIVRAAAPKVADLAFEVFMASRGEIRPSGCSYATRAALDSEARPPDVAGSPHLKREADISPAPRIRKVIRTIDRGRTLYRADCRSGWVENPADTRVKSFACYEVALSYFDSIDVAERIGDPKIVDDPIPGRFALPMAVA
jgi:hypothetical protein